MRLFPGPKALLLALFPFLAVAMCAAVSPDQKLLSLVPPDALAVVGISAPSSPNHAGSNFVITTHNNRVDVNDFLALSGVDSALAIQQLVLVAAADHTGMMTEHSLLASGRFNGARIFKSALENGAALREYGGVRVLVIQPFARELGEFNEVRWLAALGSDVMVFGSVASVQKELDRYLAGSAADPVLVRRLAGMHRDDETWCLLSMPARNAAIRSALTALDPKLAELAEDGDGFQFGIRYGSKIEFEYEVTAASAAALHTISESLTQSLAGREAGSALLPAADATGNGNTVRGVIKISKNRYSAWLEEVSARGRAVAFAASH